jgi:arylsulfatase A-like enzyme
MIENLDRWVGRYLDALNDRGELEDTIVVYAGDHGEMLGDYGMWTKFAPHQASVGVPLVVAGPGVQDRPPVQQPATILDLHATFLDYAGLTPPTDLDSRTMRPFLAGDTETCREYVRSALAGWEVVFDGRYKLVSGYDLDANGFENLRDFYVDHEGDREAAADAHDPLLFDLATEPRETTADSVADANPAIAEELTAVLR